MKVIDQIMGLCMKITWCKNHVTFYSVNEKQHTQLKFCMVVTLMVQHTIMHLHPSLPGDIPKINKKQKIKNSMRNCINK